MGMADDTLNNSGERVCYQCGGAGCHHCGVVEKPKDRRDILLRRAANALRGIRMQAERWVDYPDARATLAELIDNGY